MVSRSLNWWRQLMRGGAGETDGMHGDAGKGTDLSKSAER